MPRIINIFAEIRKGSDVVVGATVIATIYKPNGDSTRSETRESQQYLLQLFRRLLWFWSL